MSPEDTKHDIFISYRRDGGFETARYLYDHLKWDGYVVTFDLDTLRNGRFDEALLDRIDECTDFIAVLNKGCFDRTLDPGFPKENDWLRRELGYAIEKGKNVIPVLLGGFTFPPKLPSDIDVIRFINAPPYSREYIDTFYKTLKTFLKTKGPTADKSPTAVLPVDNGGGLDADIPMLGKPVDEVSLTTLEGVDAEKFSAAMAHYRVLRRRSALRELEGIGKQDDPLVRWYSLRFRYELDGDVDEGTLEKACIAARDRGCTDAMCAFAVRHLKPDGGIDVVGKPECISWLKKSIAGGNAAALVDLGAAYHDGLGVDKRPALARELYRKSSDAGALEGRVHLGFDYLMGNNGPKDLLEAAKIFRPLLRHFQKMEDELTAQEWNFLAVCHLLGGTLERNPTAGLKYMEKSIAAKGKEIGNASSERAMALVFLGGLLLSGEGIEHDGERAYHCFSEAQSLGTTSGEAEYGLSQCYEHGFGVEADAEKTKLWLREAANLGCSDAQTQLALEYFGEGPERDIQRGRVLLREAAENGNGTAQVILGRFWATGLYFEKDVDAGMEWLKKAAAAGHGDAMNALGEFFRDGVEGVPQDAGQAVAWFRKGAEAGSAEAMTNFGMALLEGIGCRRDVQEAKAWFRKAASGGDADAECALGTRFYQGDFGERNVEEALAWWEKAAEHGNTTAMVNLGDYYQDETNGTLDLTLSERWFLKAAEAGNADAMFKLGTSYNLGDFGSTDAQLAVKWYCKAASLGNTEAMWGLGTMYERGEGVEKDTKAAVEWYRRSAEAGNTYGMVDFAIALLRGEGVRQDVDAGQEWLTKAFEAGDAKAAVILGNHLAETAKDEDTKKQAIGWWTKAAEMGDGTGMLRLAGAYRDGIGVEPDTRQSFEWLQRSAEAGDEDAMELLGMAYLTGEGTAIDEEKAREWLVRAAEKGNASAECSLGTRFFNGEFGKQDIDEAIKWWEKSAEHGDTVAMINLGDFLLGEECPDRKDLEGARSWFRKAAEHGEEVACFFKALDCLGVLDARHATYEDWKKRMEQSEDSSEQLDRKLKKARSWFARPVDDQSEDSDLVSACRLWMARIARIAGDEQEAKELYRQSAEAGNEKAAKELKDMEGGAAVMAGASAGAAIGAVVPGIGAVVGAGVGAAIGWFKKRMGSQ